MDFGTVLSTAQTLFAALQCTELQDMLFVSGYQSQLEALQRTVSTVKAMLLDAENREIESQAWIDMLKDVVYEADDLFDKFITIIQQKKLKEGGKASKKVPLFFSFGIAYDISQGVNKIHKKFDAIVKASLGFTIDPQHIKLRRAEETCSYVHERDIIGREDDVEKIVEHLLNDINKQISFLTIVGMGGLGKTELAQLVYNDARVTSAFPLRIWTCVSDHDQEQLDVEHILRKILSSNHDGSTKEFLPSQVREKLNSNKYLIVLDDVWTEDYNQWLKLEEFLMGGQKGSWIVLTTRSHKTARIVGHAPIKHELQGLSKEKSWCLFKKVAFGYEQSIPSDELVKVGQEIVEGCARVPLAIKVVGSHLYGQDKSKWLSFQKIGLFHSLESEACIMPILKLSYNQLHASIKSCFTYCAMFPKDYEINVTQLKRLWMAQGYIVPLNDGQSIEETAEEYVSILVQRCFFQDVVYNQYGVIMSCKTNGLMHDFALRVAEKEICVRNFTINDANIQARHLAYTSSELVQLSSTATQLRSCLYVGRDMDMKDSKMYVSASNLEGLLSKQMCLRVLDLRYSGIKSLPESIGESLHLRYLDISNNYNLEVLPKSLIKLYNLQTLILGGCMKLKELPSDFIKLVNLRALIIEKCGMKYLTCLGSLPQLKCLRLFELEELEYIDENGELGGSISASRPVGRLMIAEGRLSFPCLENLRLGYLPKLKGWGNSRLEIGDNSTGSGSMTGILLPQLKTFHIVSCKNMKCKLLLPKLEELVLSVFNESFEINRVTSSSSWYYGVPKLKKVYISGNVEWLMRMPLESFLFLETLCIRFDRQIESLREVGEVFRCCSSSLTSLKIIHCPKLKSVISGILGNLSALESLQFHNCDMLSLSEKEERDDGICIGLLCPRFLHSLRRLSLHSLPKMVNLPNWIQFCTALETLEIINCDGLETMPDWIANIPSINIR